MVEPPTGIPEVDAVLDAFHPAVAAWVREQFDSPTEVQLRGWDAIGRGEDVLLGAPTGSGKTLAAFLSGIDQLFREPEPESGERLRLVYVSPLRALNYDIERNLRAPLQGIRRHAERLGLSVPELRVGVRTGDTSQSERQRQRRNPPDIFITTPESLYVMLTSGARELFDHVRWVIVDEIHALASSKRGTHLAFTLERLALRTQEAMGADRGPQRIGLSATQRPIERIAAFLGGCAHERAPVTVIDAPGAKQHDLQVVVPVDDMTAVGSKIVADDLADLDVPTSNANDTYSIWSVLHAEILDHVEAHTSTIVFVNSRRLAERLATALNELAERRQLARLVAEQRAEHEAKGLQWTDDTEVVVPADLETPVVARAHHGSISRETRTEMEELLKAGQLPCIVATSSLELGIDMGAVDLVLLVESPRSVASGLQRVGRAGHGVGDVSRGRIYPKHRADLVEAAAVTRLMSRREIEPVHVPELCLDVLAQQVVATCAERAFTVTELLDLTRRAWPWREISDDQFHNLLSLLAGYFPVDEAADIKARVTWDRDTDEVRTRSDAAKVAITNAGTIPDRGLYGVFVVGGGPNARVGELDEEMVHETRLGDVIVLGSTSWRVEEITRDRVHVSPQPGAIGKPPFWHGEGAGRTVELGRAVGELVRTVADASPDATSLDDPQLAAAVDDEADADLLERLERDYLCDRRAARNLVAFVREQLAATGAAPDDRTIVVERFRDELGDWRVCILSPFGKPVHAPWAMAIEERLMAERGIDATALWSDDGIALRLPDLGEDGIAIPVEALLPDPDELEDLLVAKLGGSALFASRFREVATRALVLPLSSFRRRSPLWLQRMRAQDVLRVAQEQASFPLILETYRECMRDVFSLPDLRALLRGIHERSVAVVEVETQSASAMSASLLFDYTGAFMYDYDGDKPSTERRVQALSLDQSLLRELLGTGELRELLEQEAIEEVHAELQRTMEGRRARSADQLHDLLRSLGDLTRAELVDRAEGDESQLDAWLAQLRSERRAVPIRVGDDERWISVEDTGDYVAVLGVQAPPGVPGVFLDPSPRPLARLAARRARTVTPFTTAELAARWDIPAAELDGALESLVAAGSLLRGAFLPGGRTQEWCDPDVLRRLRRRTLSRLRREIEPTDRAALARFLLGWHGLQQPPAGSVAATRDVVIQLEGIEAVPLQWERDLVAPRLSTWRAQWLDELVKTGQVTWMGRGVRNGAIQVALFAADHFDLLAPEPDELPDDEDCRVVHASLAAGGASFVGDLVRATGLTFERALAALWRLAAAGHVTNDSWSTLRAGAATIARRASPAAAGVETPTGPRAMSRRAGLRTRRRGSMRRGSASASGDGDVRFQGRWSLLPTARASEDERVAAMGDALLDTFGIVTRTAVQARPVPGGFAAVYRTLALQEEIGHVRRGWFVEGLGGAQFALPEAVDRLRAVREPTGGTPPVVVLRANDPAQPYGAILGWPEHPSGAPAPRRDASTYVVLRDGDLLATVSPAGRRLLVWYNDALPQVALALARVVEQRRVDRLAIEQVNDGNGLTSGVLAAFADTGFVRTPRGVRATPSTVAEVREQLRRSGRRVRVGDVQLPTHGKLPPSTLP